MYRNWIPDKSFPESRIGKLSTETERYMRNKTTSNILC
jgi:hypothetical protein